MSTWIASDPQFREHIEVILGHILQDGDSPEQLMCRFWDDYVYPGWDMHIKQGNVFLQPLSFVDDLSLAREIVFQESVAITSYP